MVAYRLFFLNWEKHFRGASDLEAETDKEAIEKARTMIRDASSCEIWDSQRFVARVSNTPARVTG